MHLHTFYAALFALVGIQIIGLNAYPMLAIPYFHDVADGLKYKKSDLSFSQADDDVLELEHLKRNHNDEHTDGTLPELERQLESATASIASTTGLPESGAAKSEIESGQPEKEQTDIGVHRPPILPHQDTTNPQNGNGNQQQAAVVEFGVGNGAGTSPLAPSMAKPFYGAARLAFGQNPEVFPTSSTSSSTTTTTLVPGTDDSSEAFEKVLEVDLPANESITPTILTTLKTTTTTATAHQSSSNVSNTNSSTTPAPSVEATTPLGIVTSTVSRLSRPRTTKVPSTTPKPTADPTLEVAGDVIIPEADKGKTASRRSVPQMSPKTAENLLSHADGRYSPFEMAQYVFWTGDEAGVAHAVEELIERGLMSRENALKFLRDIRLGIDYLQRSFENRVYSEEMRQNNIKKSFPTLSVTSPTTTTTTTTTTTESPLPRVHLERTTNDNNNPNLFQALEELAKYNRMQEVNSNQQELPDYEETTGKAKLANFLYTEYTLEEILYKLAKVMFTQSLTHGSDEAQRELQKLTDFLEREGNLGIIPTDLQRKILNVLLTALSDTLAEHPELLSAARMNLANQNQNGNRYVRLPAMHAYGSIQ